MAHRPAHETAIVTGADSGIGWASAEELTRNENARAATEAGLMVSRGQGA